MTKKERAILETRCEILARDYGLELICLQNDLEEEDIIEKLVELGLIDLDDYFYESLDVPDED